MELLGALTLETAPEEEPISLDEAKLHCRVDVDDDDTLITALIVAAREYVERTSRRALVTQVWHLVLDAWPKGDTIELPRPPLQSVDSVKYTDDDDVEHTFDDANYIVDTDGEPGRLVLRSDATWPTETLREAAAIVVEFTAGYSDDAADVPQFYRQAILLLVGHWYENREATAGTGNVHEIPLAVDNLLQLERVFVF